MKLVMVESKLFTNWIEIWKKWIEPEAESRFNQEKVFIDWRI